MKPAHKDHLQPHTPPEQLAASLVELTDKLLSVVERETELVGAGKLRAAAELASSKADLAGRYQAQVVRLKAQGKQWLATNPALASDLRARHERFRSLLELNQSVLATAHAVSEGLIRGAAGELARHSAPEGYGARGQVVRPQIRSAQPIALSRAL